MEEKTASVDVFFCCNVWGVFKKDDAMLVERKASVEANSTITIITRKDQTIIFLMNRVWKEKCKINDKQSQDYVNRYMMNTKSIRLVQLHQLPTTPNQTLFISKSTRSHNDDDDVFTQLTINTRTDTHARNTTN
jgi:hypothetical protein